MAVNPNIVVAVVDHFPQGNSDDLTVLGFISMRILSQNNRGSNWNGQFQITDELVGSGSGGPSGGPYPETRNLVN